MKREMLTKLLLYCLLCLLITVPGCYINVYSSPRARYERPVQLSRPMSAGSLFAAKSNDGWITVTGGQTADCNVTATIIARADTDEKARTIAEKTKLKLEQFSNKLTVKLEKPVLLMNQSVDVQLKAMVTKDCNVELSTDDGDITIENINGEIDIKTDDGSINLSRINGDIQIRGNDGSINIQDVNSNVGLQADKRIDIQTDDGSITISRIRGNIKVRSNDGSTGIREVAGDVDLLSDDGRITVVYSEDAGGVCNVSLVTDDAAVDFTAPPNFSASAEIITDDGSITTDLPIQVTGKLGKSGIKGKIRTGEGRLYIKTNDGLIRIR
jgi:DUF4097 and DUF4098 domain-containing protein YvlB